MYEAGDIDTHLVGMMNCIACLGTCLRLRIGGKDSEWIVFWLLQIGLNVELTIVCFAFLNKAVVVIVFGILLICMKGEVLILV